MTATTAPATTVGAPKVLLVDDRRENLMALEAVLAPLDVTMVSAQSGEDALKALLESDFAAILLDVQMPGMDGFETAELIRGRERTRHVPIIFVTALSRDLAHVARGYQAGAVDYVLKPFDPFVLRSKVQVFCDLERHRRERDRSDELIRRAWDSSPTGIALVDAEGIVVRSNRTLHALARSGGDEPDGRPVADLLAGPDRDRLALVLARLAEGSAATESFEATLAATDVPVAIIATPVPAGDGGGPSGALLQFDDLRERRRAREAQERLITEQTARAQAEALAARLGKVAAVTEGLDHLPLDRLVATLAERIVGVLGVEGACVNVLGDGDAPPLRATSGVPVPDELLRAATSENRPRSGEGGALAVPLRVEGRVVGSVGVSGAGRGTAAGPELPGLLRHAAERGALIIERAHLHDRERQIAATLQEDLMPDTLPDVPGVKIAAHFHSGGRGTQVGGDWYDALALPGGRLGIVIGDVAGRGVAAAARMGELRAVTRAYALEGHSPVEVARRLNAYQLAQGSDTMATLAYAVVEPAAGRLRYVSAGHVPLLLAPADGPASFLPRDGPPLGVLELSRYEEQVVAFGPGAMLVLYTDGLVERRSENLDEGLERLRSAIDGAPREPFAARAAALAACASDEAAEDDDVTAVFVSATETLGDNARFVLTPEPDALRALRAAFRRWLGEVRADPLETAEITLAANEAWQNAIEHGNAFSAAPITVDVGILDGEVTMTVRDLGHDGERSPDPDRGRGILLMRELMDSAEVDVGGPHGGAVTLRRRLRRPETEPQR